ncbi:hypothetical protein [Nocardia tengchongensis]|uniref:hypothetical protein n=1 Tax=Nocardia tengchongensis TaxID=2055889 RepID=UPI003657BE7A
MNRRAMLVAVGFMAIVIAVAALTWPRTDPATPAEPTAAPASSSAAASTEPAASGIEYSSDARAADEAIRQGLAVAFSWDPATEASPAAGFTRARDWFTDALAQQPNSDAGFDRGPGLQWQRWARDKTRVNAEVTVGCSGCPADTATVIHRVATIHQTAYTGQTATPLAPDLVVWTTVTKSGDRWLIDKLTF